MKRAWIAIAASVFLLAASVTTAQAGHYSCGYPRYGFSFGYGPGWWGYGGYGYGGYGYGGYGSWGYPWPAYAPAVYSTYPSYPPDVGWADTDISPGKASVYLDGEYVGIADNFDGFPSYLSVKPGRHTIEFRHAGYRTMTRSVRVPEGVVLRFNADLERGPSEPHDSVTIQPDAYPEQEQEESPGDDDSVAAPVDAPGYIKVRVTPPDASVYLDGEFFASGATMARLHGDIRLEPGSHTIEASRPGYRTARRTITLSPDERMTVVLEMDPER